MPTTSFPLTPNPEPSRQAQLRVRASDVFRLWPGDAAREVLSNLSGGARKANRVAVVLAQQELSAEEYEALEDAGVLVVEVPSTLAQSSDASIADYLTCQLNDGTNATAARMTAIGNVDRSPLERDDELLRAVDDEGKLLSFVNDPANQQGGHF